MFRPEPMCSGTANRFSGGKAEEGYSGGIGSADHTNEKRGEKHDTKNRPSHIGRASAQLPRDADQDEQENVHSGVHDIR